MTRPCNKPLRANPFTTQRDPKTGRWQVIKPYPGQTTGDPGKQHRPCKVLAQYFPQVAWTS